MRSWLFQWRSARAADASEKDFRIGRDGRVYRGAYLRLCKSCKKMFVLAASTSRGAHPPANRHLYSRENSVLGPKKIDKGGDDMG